MKAINVKFFVDVHEANKLCGTGKQLKLLIEYVRVVTALHDGTFDLFHMGGYGDHGLDKIELEFREFEDFCEFMQEVHVKDFTEFALTERELRENYKVRPVDEGSE